MGDLPSPTQGDWVGDSSAMRNAMRHMARRDQRYLSLWLQWALSRPNSAFRDEIVAANHASVPVNVLEALAQSHIRINPSLRAQLRLEEMNSLAEQS
jgi:hypothetical protein